MICCAECFRDPEIRGTIISLNHQGNCPICGSQNTWIYDSEIDFEQTDFEENITSILKIYKAEDELNDEIPIEEKQLLEKHLLHDWNIFAVSESKIRQIISDIVERSLSLKKNILDQNVAIPELHNEAYLKQYSILKENSWEEFRKNLRNNQRFHSDMLNLDVLKEILEETELNISAGTKLYRARIMKNGKKFSKKEMGAPPADIASAGRANSKGISCLYLASKKETTVKEIRAAAFDYVTIGTFRMNRDLKVVDLSSITHNSPFYSKVDKIKYLINEMHLRKIDGDLAKPVSSRDSELDYLPTQYISDFVKFLGYDGVKYISTFDKQTYNLALFDQSVCDMIYSRIYVIDNLDYRLNVLK